MDAEGSKHSSQRGELRTPGGGGDADASFTTERWLEFNDSSFLAEDSKIGNEGDDGDPHSETFNFGARLGDLSCSLLNCDGGQHDEGPLEESIVENLVSALGKRDVTIAKLNSCLSTFLSQKGEGDSILNSVEKNLESLADGLRNSNFLTNSKPTWVRKAVDNNVASTQTEDLAIEEAWKASKSIRDFGTSISPAMFENLNSFGEDTPLNLNVNQGQQGTHEEIHQGEQDSDMEEENQPETGCSPSKRRLSFAMNPDSLRLTFSPSICEYEAESHCVPHDYASGPAIEDLRLQVIDFERKLEAEKKFLTEMTLDREQEREDFQRKLNMLAVKYQDVRREKEKLENTVEQQQLEISELEEHFREKELVEDQLINKDCQLQQAVEKVFELREIIRSQEELIESITKQSRVAQDLKKETSDTLDVDSDLSEACNEICQKDTSCMSEMDHAEELQAQVDELAKKIEEKLLELENFSWQNRPNSSCSVTGDDVSVRGASSRVPNCDDSTDARDFVSRVFCGLRRLECSFDGLVRFEEVLLKKMKDAELKAGIDVKKIDELKAENGKIASDLTTCRNKIKDFEAFLTQNKRQDGDSFSNHSVEKLRNVVGVSFSKPFDSNSSPILRLHHNLRRDVDQTFPISTTEDMQLQQFEDDIRILSAPLKSAEALNTPILVAEKPNHVDNESKPLEGALPNSEITAHPISQESQQFSDESSKPLESALSNPNVTEHPIESFRQESQQFVIDESKPQEGILSNPETENPIEPFQESQQFSVTESQPLEIASSSPDVPETLADPSSQPSLERRTSVPEQIVEVDVKKDPSVKKLPSEVELPRAYSSQDVLNEPVSSDEGIGKSLIQGTSDEKIQAKSDLIETETIEVITVSEFEVDGDNLTHLGTELEDVLQPVPEDGPPERTPSLPNESGVLTYELNTVTNVIIDENGEPVNMEESIIPPEDLNSVVENNDSQISRLEGMDVILELEKIKTQLSQTQRALDAEKEKSQILEQTLNQISVEPNQQRPNGDVSSFRDPTVEQEVAELVYEVKRQHDKYAKHMNCALKRIKQLQQENDDLRAQIESLENGDQEIYYPEDQM